MRLESLIRKCGPEEGRVRPVVKKPEDCLIIRVRMARAVLSN